MSLKYIAVVSIHVVDRALYSFDGPPPSNALLGGRSLFTIRAGSTVRPADVGGAASFNELCDAEAVALEGSGDARIARKMAASRAECSPHA